MYPPATPPLQRRRTTAYPLRTRPGVAPLCHHQLLSVYIAPYRGTPLARFPRSPGHDDLTALAGAGAGQRAADPVGALSPAFLSCADFRGVDQNLLYGSRLCPDSQRDALTFSATLAL